MANQAFEPPVVGLNARAVRGARGNRVGSESYQRNRTSIYRASDIGPEDIGGPSAL